jgi:hypothetical protein
MRFGKHVFISYAHGDNLEVVGQGWVSRFHELLEGFLTSNLKRTKAVIWRDKRLADNDVFDPVIMEQLPDSAVLVAVLSDNYVESEWCRREAEAFCDAAQKTFGLAPNNKSRLFKIIRLPPERQDALPAALRETIGSKFFVRVDKDERESKDENDKPLPLDPCYGDDYGKRLNLRVSLLAQDIANTLKAIDAAGSTEVTRATAADSVKRPTVYLAQCGSDRHEHRDALRSELTMRGYAVLPHRELPSDEAACRAEVAKLLERSALSVHLLGASPGMVPDGSEDSVVVVQNALAVERARVAPLQRVVSLADSTVSKSARYQQFLEAMRRDAELQFRAELISADLEAVKGAVQAALARLEAPSPAAEALSANAVTVYVIFDERDRKATVALRKSLAARGLTVQTPVFEGPAKEVREANEQRLAGCDGVLVFYGSGTDAWKASVDSDLRKAAALRPGRRLSRVFIWLAEPATGAKADAIDMAEPNVIDGLSGFSEELLEPIVTSLLEARHG